MTSEQPPTSPARRRRLVRPAGSRQIAGVAAGLADHFDLSIGLVRLGFVALAFAGGFGFVLYVLGWLLIPEEGEAESIADRAVSGDDGDTNWLGVALLVLVAMILLGSLDFIQGDFVLAAAVFAVGLLLYRGGGQTAAPKPPPPDPSVRSKAGTSGESPFMDAALAEIAEIDSPAILDEAGPLLGDVGYRRDASAKRATSSLLGRLTLASALVAVGVLAALDTLGIFHPSVSDYLLLVLAVIGIGLLIGSFLGRARWLIVPGLLLVPIVLVTSLVTVPLASSFGEFYIAPDSAETLNDSYVYGGADVEFDLRDLSGGLTADDEATIELGAGQLTIVVPADLNLIVEAEVAAGDFEVDVSPGVQPGSYPGDASGVLIDSRLERLVDDGPVVTLLVEVGFGVVNIDLVDG